MTDRPSPSDVPPEPTPQSSDAFFAQVTCDRLVGPPEPWTPGYDIAGRRVWGRDLGGLPPVRHEIAWDGRSDSGDPAASGVHFARLDGVRAASAFRLVRIR